MLAQVKKTAVTVEPQKRKATPSLAVVIYCLKVLQTSKSSNIEDVNNNQVYFEQTWDVECWMARLYMNQGPYIKV